MKAITRQNINKKTNTLYKLGEHLRQNVFYGDVKSFPLLIRLVEDFSKQKNSLDRK